MTRRLRIPAIVAGLIAIAAAHAARADAPSGYRCGPDGTLVMGVGCKCPAGKVDGRDGDGNAICVAKATTSVRPPTNGNAAAARVRELETRCRSGQAQDCTQAATGYARGDGVSRDAGKALTLYRRACDLGDATGCTELGAMYEQTHEDATAQQLYR